MYALQLSRATHPKAVGHFGVGRAKAIYGPIKIRAWKSDGLCLASKVITVAYYLLINGKSSYFINVMIF